MQGVNRETGRALGGLDHLRQSIRDILTTRVGTRVMRRDYGSRLPELVDNPINDALRMDVYAATVDALARWEPRLRIRKVALTAAEPGALTLFLEGIYLPTGQEMKLDRIIIT